MSFYVSTASFFLLHCDEWDRVVALPRHKFVTGATLLQLVSTTDTQQNIEPPYPDIAKLTVMDDTVKRKLLSSKWNDSHIFKFPSRYIN